jgi:hypothetical protein
LGDHAPARAASNVDCADLQWYASHDHLSKYITTIL